MILLYFSDWKLKITEAKSQQYDNLTIPVLAVGLPADYSVWELYVECEKGLDIIQLTATEGGYGCTLSRDQLSFAGVYYFQIVGKDGDRERHTSIANIVVPRSISGDAHWPTLPTAFSDALEEAVDAAERAEEASEHYPYIDTDTNHWFVWDVDTGEYVDTHIDAGGGSVSVYMRVYNGYIQYSADYETWHNLIAVDDLKGEDGNGISSAVLNADYTLTLTFTNGTSYTTPSIRGASGYSPVVTITSVTGGTQVTITDENGAHTFTVLNGTDGHTPVITASKSGGTTTIYVDGTTLATLTDGTDGVTFTPSVSNAGVISWTNDGGRQNPQSLDVVAAVLAALPTWTGGSY